MVLGVYGGQAAVTTPVDHALDQLVTALDHLVKVVEDGGLDHYDDGQLVAFMQSFERFRNQLPLIDHRVIADGERRQLATALTQPTMARVLTWALRLSSAEANRRVRAAAAVGSRISVLGEPLEAIRPELAAAQRAGDVSTEQVHIVQRALDSVDRRGFDPADIELGERLLTEYAQAFEPKALAQLADRIVDAIDPDGTVPREQLNHDRRYFTMRPTKDGAYVGEFRLTGALGSKLTALLSPLSKPRVENIPGADADADGAVVPRSGFTTDERTFGQRMHDGLEDLCDRVLRAGSVPDSGGTPATVIVTIALEDLLDRLGYGRTSDGTLISAVDVLKLANEAEVIPTVMSQSGAVLDQGRARRVATRQQTWALVARDHGCSFPGCDRPPELCERHHVVEWARGGLTNLDNLTLLCRYHHHNFAGRGWSVSINPDGLPEWVPPRWVDPAQRPIVHPRIRLARRPRPVRRE